MISTINAVLADDAGQGLVEYGLILAFVSVVCVVALTAVGTNINALLTKVAGDI